MKICKDCKEEKHEICFFKDVSKKDGLRNNCKSCESIKKKKKYEELTQQNRRYDLEPNVEDGDSIYHITKDGIVINRRTGNDVKPRIRNGYKYVLIYKKDGSSMKKNIHRLLCIAYIKNPFNKPQVNHIDGNKLNNNLLNLEWATARENTVHAFKNNLINVSKGDKHYMTINAGNLGRSIIATDKYGKEFIFKNISDALNKGFALKKSYSKVYDCCNLKRKIHNGYKWRYL